MTVSRLPTDSLAKLIRLAIKDARSLDRDMFEPNFGEWLRKAYVHKRRAREDWRLSAVCLVCLAGAVMANSFDYDALPRRTFPGDEIFTDEEAQALKVLNSVREGDYECAYMVLGRLDLAVRAREAIGGGQLPLPKNRHFHGWKAFDSHLTSLEGIADELETLEKENSA